MLKRCFLIKAEFLKNPGSGFWSCSEEGRVWPWCRAAPLPCLPCDVRGCRRCLRRKGCSVHAERDATKYAK